MRRPVPERSAGQEAGGQKVCGAEDSLPPAPVASGAILTSVFEPAFLSSAAHNAALRHPVDKEEKGMQGEDEDINNYRATNG